VDSTPRGLKASAESLVDCYDCAMLDLDGVVYVGGDAVTGVPELLKRARQRGMTLAFVTNNAARTPAAVAAQLRDLGVQADATDVVTSAQAAAREVSRRVPRGSRVLVVGGEGLLEALREQGLTPVSAKSEDPAAVVQGFHPTVGWTLLAEAAYTLRQLNVPWVASNLDLTIPTSGGIAPGNGALVNVVAEAAGRRPDVVAGKPFRPLFDETVRRIHSTRPLVVGDRLDTDIQGAVTCGADSLLVMTGVTDVPQLCRAESAQRPDYVGWTMEALLQPQPVPTQNRAGRWELGGWSAAVEGDRLVVDDHGDSADDGLRVVVCACWQAVDAKPDVSLDVSAVESLRPSR
jgi:glycerol 3-phosphatase-2